MLGVFATDGAPCASPTPANATRTITPDETPHVAGLPTTDRKFDNQRMDNHVWIDDKVVILEENRAWIDKPFYVIGTL